MLRALLAAVLLGLPMSSPCVSVELDEGWWVIVATYPTDPPERQAGDAARTQARAAPCHVEPFNDLSLKFKGFAPGYNVFVVGAFETKAQAERQRAALQPCFPDAYLKRGKYLGE